MTDVVDRSTRSRMMSSIRGKETRPEISVRRYLSGAGLRFRLHDKRLPGTPDIVLPSCRSVVLVHGCFWHRHPGCRLAATPSSNVEFWQHKFAANVARDTRKAKEIEALGWAVLVVWECQSEDELELDRLVWNLILRRSLRAGARGVPKYLSSHP